MRHGIQKQTTDLRISASLAKLSEKLGGAAVPDLADLRVRGDSVHAETCTIRCQGERTIKSLS